MEDRRVRLLRLKRIPREKVAGLVAKLEDALRVASLPSGRPGELLLVRRLDLGEIDPDAPSQKIALRIEALVRQILGRRVHAEAAGAEVSEVVYFRDEAECRAILISRILKGQASKEWFWAASPLRLSPGAGPPSIEQILTLPTPISASEAPPILLFARILNELARRSLLLPTIRALPESGEWQRSLPAVAFPEVPAVGRLPSPELPLFWKKELIESLKEAESHPRRNALIWMAALVQQRPTLSRSLALPVLARQVLHFLKQEEEGGEVLGHPLMPPRAPPLLQKQEVPPAGSEFPAREERALDPSPPPPPVSPPPPGSSAVPETSAKTPDPYKNTPLPSPLPEKVAPNPPKWLPERGWKPHWVSLGIPALEGLQITTAGGLFFSIPILERLHFPGWMEQRETLYESGFGWRVLSELLQHSMNPTTEDPLLLLCNMLGPGEVIEDPSPWVDQVESWLSRTHEENPLRWLIGREALCALTETHIDVVLPISSATLSLRRWALDTDPGWVPWLGRVIVSHYLEDGDFLRLKGWVESQLPSG